MKDQLPLITFALITYNQEAFINDALDGAFSQTYSPMEIIISDDCSSDATFDIIKYRVEQYNGPHRIIINQNTKNLGIAKNYNKVCELASGDIIINAAGDDKAFPNRTKLTYDLFAKYPEAVCVNFESIECDSHLNPISDHLLKLNKGLTNKESCINVIDYCSFTDFTLWSGDTRAIKKEVFYFFGPFTLCNDEDSSLFFRSFLFGSVCHSMEPVSYRRIHSRNVSNTHNIKRFSSSDVISQPLLDINFALSKGIINEEVAGLMQWKVKQFNRRLADGFFYRKNILYRIIYHLPVSILTKLKNRIFI